MHRRGRTRHEATGDRSVLHATSTHHPDDVRIHQREVRSLHRSGYDVELLVCSPLADEPIVSGDSAPIVRVPRRRTLLDRVVKANLAVVRYVRQTRPAIVHVHEPDLIASLVVARLLGSATVFDAHEDFGARARDRLGGTRGAIAGRIYDLVERVALSLSGASIVAATEAIERRYDKRSSITVHNYPTEQETRWIARLAEEPFDWSTSGHDAPGPYAIYTGLLTEERGIGDIVATAAANDGHPGWTLVTAGPGSDEFLDRLAAEHSGAAWIHLGMLEREDALRLTAHAEVGLVPFRDANNHREAMPNKLFEYQAAGIPTLATNFPLWQRIVDEQGFGRTCDFSDTANAARLIGEYCAGDLGDGEGSRAQEHALANGAWEADLDALRSLYESAMR